MKKVANFANFVAAIQVIANTLTGTAKQFADAVVDAFEALADDANEHDIDALKNAIADVEARFAKQDQAVAERIAAVRDSIIAELGKSVVDSVKSKFTPKVCNDVARALLRANNKQDALRQIDAVMVENEITGLTYGEIVDYAIQFRQDDSDELFDSLRKTNRTRFFYANIDADEVSQIAKQWGGVSASVTRKQVQELEVEGKTLSTKYVYKMQRAANEDLDAAEEAGELGVLEDDVRGELRKGVKAIAVRSILVGDTVNADGSKVTTFETIGSKTVTDLFTTVLTGSISSASDLPLVRQLAESVKTDGAKVAVMSAASKLVLATRVYATGGTPIMLSDEELAAQLGVAKIVTKEYLGNVACIVLDPAEYWLKERKTIDVAFPQYESNTRNYLYEINMGGFIHGIKSTAVLRTA